MKVYLDTVGCRLNQSEIENYARQLRAAGHTIVSTPDEADLVIVNTCTVTAAAASDSRQKIRQAARAGKGGTGEVKVIATGCWATLEPQAAAALPGVTHVVPNDAKDALVPNLLNIPLEVFDLHPIEREPLPGPRSRTRAFIKAQDGCDNRCTFCITTVARGPGRSRPVPAVLADIQAALQGGTQEVVLTGVHLGSWGKDLQPVLHLKDLVQAVLDEANPPRLRLSSVEPWDLDEGFFGLWQDPRLCPHLHLPLQSGCAATLRRMARKTTPASYAALLDAARRAIPGLAVTTDIITGFPGENEAEFAESLDFVRQMSFAGGHVFTYSARQGTAAARMPGQVPHPLRQVRNAQLRSAFHDAAQVYQQAFIGQILPVLWESCQPNGGGQWTVEGLTPNYLRVTARAKGNLWNTISPVRLERVEKDGVFGVIVE